MLCMKPSKWHDVFTIFIPSRSSVLPSVSLRNVEPKPSVGSRQEELARDALCVDSKWMRVRCRCSNYILLPVVEKEGTHILLVDALSARPRERHLQRKSEGSEKLPAGLARSDRPLVILTNAPRNRAGNDSFDVQLSARIALEPRDSHCTAACFPLGCADSRFSDSRLLLLLATGSLALLGKFAATSHHCDDIMMLSGR